MRLRKRDLRKFEQTFELRKRDCELFSSRLRLFESRLRSAWPGFQYSKSHRFALSESNAVEDFVEVGFLGAILNDFDPRGEPQGIIKDNQGPPIG